MERGKTFSQVNHANWSPCVDTKYKGKTTIQNVETKLDRRLPKKKDNMRTP